MDMSNFMNTYFGPLGEEYCVYFYALSIFFGIGTQPGLSFPG